jgi:hypothetical protein
VQAVAHEPSVAEPGPGELALELGPDPLCVGAGALVVEAYSSIAKACPLLDAVPGGRGEGEHPSPVRVGTALPEGTAPAVLREGHTALRGDHDGVARRTGDARWRRVGCVRHDEVIEARATRDSHAKGTRPNHLLVATSGKLVRDLARGRRTVAVDRARAILVATGARLPQITPPRYYRNRYHLPILSRGNGGVDLASQESPARYPQDGHEFGKKLRKSGWQPLRCP